MNAEYNPLAPFSKGEFCRDAPAGRLYSPLIKGDLGGCHTPFTQARELLPRMDANNIIL